MTLDIIKLQTTWNDAAGSINSNYAKIADAIAQLKANGGGGGGGADIDLTDYATKVWVEAKGYITASALTPYALKTDIPSLVGYATEDFVNNKLGDYATKDFVDNKLVDYAPLTSVQGFENRIGGLEGAVPQLNERVETVESKVATLNEYVVTGENNLLDRVNTIETEYATKTYVDNAIDGIDLSAYLLKADLTKSRIQSTLGISDWALAATKPSYAWSEITSRPTALSQFTDDVVAGKYLPLSGGTMVGEFAIKADATNSATIRFRPNDGAINHWLGVNRAGVLWFSNNGWSQQYDILHSGNIGNYKLSQFTDDVVAGKYLPLSGGTLSNALWRSQLTIERSGSANDSVIAFKNSNGLLGCLGYQGADGIPCVWLGETGTGTPIIHANNIGNYNAGSATKLQTPRTLWGQSFDGTNKVSGDINNAAGGIYIHKTNEINSFNGKLYLNHQGSGLTGYGSTNDIVMVANGGKVGIGTTSPTERLDVSGNIKASGNINATSITINGVTITASNGSITVNGNVFATGDITGFV